MIVIYFILTLYYYIAMILLFVIATPVSLAIWLITTPFDKHRKFVHLNNCFIGKIIMACNPFWKTMVTGLDKVDKNDTYVIASNHQSLSDILMLTYLMPLQFKYVAKKELIYIPFIGWILAMAKNVLLNRRDPKSQFKMMRKSENYLKNGVSIAIFPEGTRTKNGELSRFKDGASLLAIKTNTKVLPICMVGNSYSMPKNGFIWNKRVPMTINILDPISPEGYSKSKDLTNVIKEVIGEELSKKSQGLKI